MSNLIERVAKPDGTFVEVAGKKYRLRVQQLEHDGMTTSDAQGVADAEVLMYGDVQLAEVREIEVCISHDTSEQTIVKVMAHSKESAILLAREVDLSDAEWEQTDYIGDDQFDVLESGAV